MVKITFFTVDPENDFVRYQYVDATSIETHYLQVENTKFVSDYNIKSNLMGDMLLMFHTPDDLNLYPLPLNRSTFEPDVDAKYYYNNQTQQNPNSIPEELKSDISEYNSLKSQIMTLISTVEQTASHTLGGIQSIVSNSKTQPTGATATSGSKNEENSETQKKISLIKKKDWKKFQKWMK